ncbi:glucose-6-phosphate isomerase [Ottowia sp.]|uniref:glucose-6-phosphate isomerase n=1 Tax=Ottowia sp. TaxID=1898956 RepID=UPI002BD906CD|nr:glucose-6-phosphate isomerase [Ottowia sp.]HOB67789.1 glucose-6-phosphate isomerase [Ottowia sp.]HPZ58508.1 glucose-6-phosphate isomerase [Ottowia sp.]HQD47795.1 glucose-6-phosphate isomerase [Ottowia sp.]
MNWQERPRCDETPAWALLQRHFAQRFAGAQAFDLRLAFAEEGARRVERFSFDAPGVFADLSKNLIDDEAQRLLTQLAQQCGVEVLRDALWAGERINTSEQRAVTHVHWRCGSNQALALDGQAQVAIENIASMRRRMAEAQSAMLDFADAVRADAGITDVVNIGIGGSDLGPRMVVQALRSAGQARGPRVHFVANMDGHELAELLPHLQADRTLFVVSSKTFGTAETMQNAASARAWFAAQGGRDVARHFVGVSANTAAVAAFGAGRCFAFDEGVGGRFSLWSSIGFPIALAVGRASFEALLSGARAMDQHFTQMPLGRNLPVQLALLDVWNRNFHRFASRCVAPYHHGLRRLPAYLQQLEMESNGKCVDVRGRTVPFDTAPVVWGEAGSNGQHAFFQMLHQGTQPVPVEFVAVRQAAHALEGHHDRLLANALAQARALMLGDAGDAPQRHFSGNRPSTFLVLDRLDPAGLGALLALYEHRVFVAGAIWGINSFDQWGVELGKRHAGLIERALGSRGETDGAAGDPSTAALARRLR